MLLYWKQQHKNPKIKKKTKQGKNKNKAIKKKRGGKNSTTNNTESAQKIKLMCHIPIY